MYSHATTIDNYIASLSLERQNLIKELRTIILKHLPQSTTDGFAETMQNGMISYVVPHSLYPAGYHCNSSLPLPFIGLASQKQHITIYHMGLYSEELLNWLLQEWENNWQEKLGKLNMGKCCLRLNPKKPLPYILIGELVTKISAQDWIKIYENNRQK